MTEEGDDLFSFYAKNSGEKLRDAGIALVTENSGTWMQRAKDAVYRYLPSDWVGTGEDIRGIVTRVIGEPHNPHAWGALTKTLSEPRTGLLIDTGTVRKMLEPKSHARRTPVYRVR